MWVGSCFASIFYKRDSSAGCSLAPWNWSHSPREDKASQLDIKFEEVFSPSFSWYGKFFRYSVGNEYKAYGIAWAFPCTSSVTAVTTLLLSAHLTSMPCPRPDLSPLPVRNTNIFQRTTTTQGWYKFQSNKKMVQMQNHCCVNLNNAKHVYNKGDTLGTYRV